MYEKEDSFLIVWLALTGLYVFNITDIERFMGAHTNSVIE